MALQPKTFHVVVIGCLVFRRLVETGDVHGGFKGEG
jgi:hypothetical protein